MTVERPGKAQYVSSSRRPMARPSASKACIAVSDIHRSMDNRPFIWFEGAVSATTSAADAASRTEAEAGSVKKSNVMATAASTASDGNRVAVQINEDEMLSDAPS
jgi:hypothetical protein